MCEASTSWLTCRDLSYHTEDRTSPFQTMGVCIPQDQKPVRPLGIKLFGTLPPNPNENKIRENGLCGPIFPCVQLHACLGGDAGVVTGLQR